KLDGSEENICELQRMYLLPEARGKGIGQKLMDKCIEKASEFSYEKMYLESLSNMKDAYKLYTKNGFVKIEEPLGNTGHGGCNVFMLKEI
ncbi:MAG: GNAT family N-acetyltransferase, partial [Bacteroidia bacterium]